MAAGSVKFGPRVQPEKNNNTTRNGVNVFICNIRLLIGNLRLLFLNFPFFLIAGKLADKDE